MANVNVREGNVAVSFCLHGVLMDTVQVVKQANIYHYTATSYKTAMFM
jgi:uncharacterized membrane protein YjfL (UPF0719 family)